MAGTGDRRPDRTARPYYVAGQGDGTFTLYDTADHAKAGGDDGLIAFTSAGTGNRAGIHPATVRRNPDRHDFVRCRPATVTVLDLDSTNDLHTGDVVTYDNGGGSDMGGLTNGTEYYVIDLTGGNFRRCWRRRLMTLRPAPRSLWARPGRPATQALVDITDNNRAEATSGASGGKIGVSVSLGVNVVSMTRHRPASAIWPLADRSER